MFLAHQVDRLYGRPYARHSDTIALVNDREAHDAPDFPLTNPQAPRQPAGHGSMTPAPVREDRGGTALESWLYAPFLALQFLTIMPPVYRAFPRPRDLGRSEAFFPVVGLILGAILAVTDRIVEPYVPPLVRDALLVILLAALTGALHLDGVIDTFDGLFIAGNRDRRLAVMRDPRAGAYGVVAVVLLLGLKLAALGSLPSHIRFGALLAAPCLGRWAIVLVTSQFPYARQEGMGQAFKQSLRWTHVVVAGAIAAEVAVLVLGVSGIAVWFAASVGALLVAHYMASRLGGLTGDTYGAICELVETGTLVALGLTIRGFG